ncbi:SIR2 family protein [Parabacteroides sp. 52]|nr:SIR2 family protein [Parabacteroides sp. 52]
MMEMLFELIRKEDVLLWAGAGFSYYAGYPLGRDIPNILYNNLSISEKEDIQYCYDLQRLAEDIINVRGDRRQLIDELSNIFQKEPSRIDAHQKLAMIPHIRTIITTNYDSLFEIVYKDRIVKIVSEKDLCKVNRNGICLIKAHGDFTHPEDLVISKSDYEKIYHDNFSSLLWNLITSKLCTNHIVFIGYSLDDSNVSILINKIISRLGDHRKEMFYISPYENRSKLNFLKKNNIHYIETTGEDFIDKLDKHIKNHLLPDVLAKSTSPNILSEYLRTRNRDVRYEVETDNQIRVKEIKSIETGESFFPSFKFNLKDTSLFEQISNPTSFDSIEITNDKFSDLEAWFSDLRMPIPKNIEKIIFSIPEEEKVADIIFKDIEFDYLNIKTKIRGVKNQKEIKFEFEEGFIMLKTKLHDGVLNISSTVTHYDKHTKIDKEIKFNRLIINMFSGYAFRIDMDGVSLDFTFPDSKSMKSKSLELLNLFQKVKKIENFYNFHFDEIGIITHRDIKCISFLYDNIINENVCRYSLDEKFWDKEFAMRMEMDTQKKDRVIKDLESNNFSVCFYDSQTLLLFDRPVDIGHFHISAINYKYEILYDKKRDDIFFVQLIVHENNLKINYKKDVLID